MKISGRFGGQYLKAGHVPKPLLLTIAQVVDEPMQGDPRNVKPVVYFEETDRGLVLNSTNGNAIASFLGDDTEGWRRGKIVVYATRCDFQGRQVDCLRVRKPKNQQPEPEPASATADDCPF